MKHKRNNYNGPEYKANISNLWPLLSYLAPYKKYIAGAIIALCVTSTSVLGLGKGVGYLVDEGLSGNNPHLLNIALFTLLCITVLLAIGTYTRFYCITYTGEMVVADIKREMYKRILQLSPDFFEQAKTGDILFRITSDTNLIQMVVGSSLSIALRNSLMLLGGIILLIHTSPKLSLIVAIVIPLVVVPIIILGKRLRHLSRIAQNKMSVISSHSEESINGIKTIQAFAREDHENTYFNCHLKEALNAAKDRIKIRSLLTAIIILFVFGSIGFVLWVGGHDVLSGKMSAGSLSSFIFYSILVAGTTGAISEVIGDLQRAAGAAERIIELLNTQPTIKTIDKPLSIKNKKSLDISFDNVNFTYPSNPDTPSLQSFNLHIKKGETIALVGPSGAGKSTVIQLLLRFYDISQGKISIGGIDISTLSLNELRNLFALVPQDPIIFSNSAYQNILFAKPDASEEDVKKAVKNAAALDFLEALPDGLQSHLGEKGVFLSGGQKQRIAIARAFLKNPEILLLDEATSALDVENEQLVQQAFDKIMKNRTTIVIAHRLSTVQKADKIVVIENGLISETGTHKQLIQKKGVYARLLKKQFEPSQALN